MKKVLLTLSVVLLAVCFMYGSANALSGVCSNCHTMHNSQNGTVIDASGPNERLLTYDCIPCHSTSGTGATGTTGAPAVLHTGTIPSATGGGLTNAGGDFRWVQSDDTKGHNVVGIAAADGNITPASTPPGFDAAATASLTLGSDSLQVGSSWNDTTNRLTCAGVYGCHGTRASGQVNFTAIAGAHHNNDGLTTTQATSPTTVGESFRFLGGIKGLEDSDWNWTESAASHNEYYGTNYTADRSGSSNWGSRDTISFLCGECHGLFHGSIDADASAGSPWVRHPTDIVLPAGTTEYASYNPDNGNVYSVQAPVARPTVPAVSTDTVTPGDSTTADGAIVMCLSCHRAHGSDQPDLLRWAYSGMQAGTGTADTGCFVCHTTKNGD